MYDSIYFLIFRFVFFKNSPTSEKMALALRKKRRIQRERLKQIDKALSRLRAIDQNVGSSEKLVSREEVDALVQEVDFDLKARHKFY